MVDVFNEQGDDLLSLDLFFVFLSYLVRVIFLHSENDIGPADIAFREPDPCSLFRASRPNLIAIEFFVHLLSREASVFVDATNEEDFLWVC